MREVWGAPSSTQGSLMTKPTDKPPRGRTPKQRSTLLALEARVAVIELILRNAGMNAPVEERESQP